MDYRETTQHTLQTNLQRGLNVAQQLGGGVYEGLQETIIRNHLQQALCVKWSMFVGCKM